MLHALLLVSALFLSVGIPARAAEIELPAGNGRDLVYGKCRTCHDLQYLVDSAGIDEATWDGLLDDMEGYGCEFTADQRERLLAYLATYLGPTPPPAEVSAATAAAEVDGETLFRDQCASCHQEDGRGVEGDFPPLDGNPDLFTDRMFPVYVLLFGLEGEIDVLGKTYTGIMPSFGHLSDVEIATLVRYIRNAWSNRARYTPALELSGDDVRAAREKPLNPTAVHVYRAQQVATSRP